MPLSARSATPAERSTQDLYNDCKSADPGLQIACVRFMSGVAGMMGIAATLETEFKAPDAKIALKVVAMCNTEFVSAAQMRQAFINWAEKNPTKWQLPESFGAWSAIGDAWRCH